MQEIELDTKILNKNLEITRIYKQLDNLTSDYVELKEQCREQVPMYMLNTLEKCSDALKELEIIRDETDKEHDMSDLVINSSDLRKDLRNVIKFLQK